MELLKNRGEWWEWMRNEMGGWNPDTAEVAEAFAPTAFPCYGHLLFEDDYYLRGVPGYLYAVDVEIMLDDLRKASQ